MPIVDTIDVQVEALVVKVLPHERMADALSLRSTVERIQRAHDVHLSVAVVLGRVLRLDFLELLLEVVLAEQVDHLLGVLVVLYLLIDHHVYLLLKLHELTLLLVVDESRRILVSTVLNVLVHLLLGHLQHVGIPALLLLLLALFFIGRLRVARIVVFVRLLASLASQLGVRVGGRHHRGPRSLLQ